MVLIVLNMFLIYHLTWYNYYKGSLIDMLLFAIGGIDMNWDIIFSFASNVLVIMGLAVVYSIFPEDKKISTLYRKFFMGGLVVILGVTVMGTSYILETGLFYDARSVILGVSGMFLGLIPTIIGMIGLGIARILIGGSGTLAGVLSILFSGGVGLGWRWFRLKKADRVDSRKHFSWYELYAVSILVSITVILAQLVLPSELRAESLQNVALPLLVFYPIGALFISMFMVVQRQRYFQSALTKSSEEQYRSLFTKSSMIQFLIDPETLMFADANEAAQAKYGYTHEQFLSMKVSDINIQTVNEINQDVKKTIELKSDFFRFHHKTKDGTIFDAEVHTGPIVLQNRTYIYSTILDVSEVRQKERNIKIINEQFRTMLLCVGDGVIVTDENGYVTLANDVALTMIGCPKTPLKQPFEKVFRAYSETSQKTIRPILDTVLKTNETFRCDSTYILNNNIDDSSIMITFTIAPILYDDTSNNGAIISIRDVTKEKQQEQKIRFISQHDYQTKLYNRYFFETELQRLDTPRQYPLTILFGDVNGLKLLNDAFGHLEEDIVCRWGGDEFVILLPKTSEDYANLIYNRIKKLCLESSFELIVPSLSIGIASKTSKEEDIFHVIKNAEEKMYREKLQEGKSMRNDLLLTLENTLIEKSNETEQHATNMRDITNRFAQKLQISQDHIHSLNLLARLHDIGKIAVSDVILYKTDPLTDEDWVQIKLHPEAGARIVQNIPELTQISDGILCHHERWDGTGYPNGIKEEEIPLISRVISIVDAYEVMVNGRTYKPRISHEEAIVELRRCSGSQFDPNLVPLFETIFDNNI